MPLATNVEADPTTGSRSGLFCSTSVNAAIEVALSGFTSVHDDGTAMLKWSAWSRNDVKPDGVLALLGPATARLFELPGVCGARPARITTPATAAATKRTAIPTVAAVRARLHADFRGAWTGGGTEYGRSGDAGMLSVYGQADPGGGHAGCGSQLAGRASPDATIDEVG